MRCSFRQAAGTIRRDLIEVGRLPIGERIFPIRRGPRYTLDDAHEATPLRVELPQVRSFFLNIFHGWSAHHVQVADAALIHGILG